MKDFIGNNFKIIMIVASFVLTMYVQHLNNIARIEDLTKRCQDLEVKIKDQYDKIDAIKLDKAVYQSTMEQFSSMRVDMREMRADIKELLKSKR